MITVAEFGLEYALTFLLIAFGIWVYRKIKWRSLPWALAYLILEFMASLIFYGVIQPRISSSPHVANPRFSPIAQFQTYLVANAVWGYANRLLLAVLVLAECTMLITKAGGNLTGKFAECWRWIYDKSTFTGCILIASMLINAIWGLFYWRIL